MNPANVVEIHLFYRALQIYQVRPAQINEKQILKEYTCWVTAAKL